MAPLTPILVGAGLALGVGAFAAAVGLERERGFYPTVLIVVASYYGLFAAVGGSPDALAAETIPLAVFVAMAVVGLRWSPWVLVAGLALHGVFDAVHGEVISNPGLPVWWPDFCMTYDLAAAAWLAWRVKPEDRTAPPPV